MVQFITYQGEKYPIRIAYYVMVMVEAETGLSFEEIEADLQAQQKVLWYALIAGHRMAKQELTLKREDIIWILDEAYLEFKAALIKYAKDLIRTQQAALQDDYDETDKKK